MDKFDRLLQENPVIVPLRKGLANDSLEMITQTKRIRMAQRIVAVLFVISSILLIAKWLNNDLDYLIKLVFYKYTFVRSQSFLYLEALVESLPKVQLFTVLFSGTLWFLWKKFETFLFQTRITNRKTFTMKVLKMTPRLLVANILLVVTILGFSGYSYAQKEEQKKLQILKEHINQTGRIEFDTDCTSGNPTMTSRYELKKNAKINNEDAKKVIAATCNYDEAEEFFNQLRRQFSEKIKEPSPENGKEGAIIQYITPVSVYKVAKRQNEQLELLDMYNTPSSSTKIKLAPAVKVYKGHTLVSTEELKDGANIMTITLNTSIMINVTPKQGGYSSSEKLKEQEILAVVILPVNPDIKWYDPHLTSYVTRISTCHGNPQDRCSFTGSIDFFPSGGGETAQNPLFTPMPPLDLKTLENKTHDKRIMKQIAGVLTEINDKSVKIKSSSGRIFTVNFESNPAEEFNQSRTQYYNDERVTLGDTIIVSYSERDDQYETTINVNQIFDADLMIEVAGKSDPIKKY